MKNDKIHLNYITGLVIETFCVFIILAATLFIEFESRNLISGEIVKEILLRSFSLSLLYLLIFRVFKSGYYILFRFISVFVPKRETKPLTLADYLTDIFITLSIILTTVPVRPILQKVYVGGGKPIFDQAMVRFDTVSTIVILSLC